MISENTITNLFHKIAVSLAEHGNIEEKYINLYAKAMEITLAVVVNLSATLLLGYCMNLGWYCVIFLIGFIPLRSYAGGYHASNYVTCFFQSMFVLTVILCGIKYFIFQGWMSSSVWQLFLISVAIIFFGAPLADENRPISEKEAVFFKKRSRVIVIIEAILVVILNCFGSNYSYAVVMAVIASAFALVLHVGMGTLKLHRKQEEIEI